MKFDCLIATFFFFKTGKEQEYKIPDPRRKTAFGERCDYICPPKRGSGYPAKKSLSSPPPPLPPLHLQYKPHLPSPGPGVSSTCRSPLPHHHFRPSLRRAGLCRSAERTARKPNEISQERSVKKKEKVVRFSLVFMMYSQGPNLNRGAPFHCSTGVRGSSGVSVLSSSSRTRGQTLKGGDKPPPHAIQASPQLRLGPATSRNGDLK